VLAYDKSVDQVMSFKYLGANSENKQWKSEKRCKAKADQSSHDVRLRDIIWRNMKYINLRSKIRMYKTYMKLVMKQERKQATFSKINGNEDFKMHYFARQNLQRRHRQYVIRMKYHKMDQNQKTSMERSCRMNDNRFAKIAKNVIT